MPKGPQGQKRPAKRATKQDDPKQSKLFVEAAREIGADESGRAFRKALKKMVPRKKASS